MNRHSAYESSLFAEVAKSCSRRVLSSQSSFAALFQIDLYIFLLVNSFQRTCAHNGHFFQGQIEIEKSFNYLSGNVILHQIA